MCNDVGVADETLNSDDQPTLEPLDRDPSDREPADLDLDAEGDEELDGKGGADDDAAAIAEEFDEHVTYEMIGWSGESRQTLDSMLTLNNIAHMWQGSTLVVRLEDEDRVEPLIDEVDHANDLSLDPTRTRVVYEVGGWPAAFQSSLAEALGIAEVPFEWNTDGDLVVYAEDEETVEDIFEAMPDPDDPDSIEGDGIDVQALLTELWEAASTLSKKPADAEATLRFVGGAEALERMSLPFGFEQAVWRALVADTLELRDVMEAEEADEQWSDAELADRAKALAWSLRPFV